MECGLGRSFSCILTARLLENQPSESDQKTDAVLYIPPGCLLNGIVRPGSATLACSCALPVRGQPSVLWRPQF
jgi:hypothetical protein